MHSSFHVDIHIAWSAPTECMTLTVGSVLSAGPRYLGSAPFLIDIPVGVMHSISTDHAIADYMTE